MVRPETLEQVVREGRERLNPAFTNPSYLVLSQRRKNFSRWLETLKQARLRVLDVGGRIQPYRPLLNSRIQQYVALDTASSPLVNVRASACHLPFPENTFDLVFCTQVLEYLSEPGRGASEIYRVLKPGGISLLSVAAFYPRAVDEEHWRFLPAGLRHILRPFGQVEIIPEGSTISGFFRSFAVCLSIFAKYPFLRMVVGVTAIPVLNVMALTLETLAKTRNDQATGNYSVLARK